jgi:hypothetical protein
MLTSGTYSGIKSIQRGSVTIASNAASGTAAIASVNTAKAELRFLGVNWNDPANGASGNITLTNSTTVTAARATATVQTVTIQFEVTEWN